MFDILGAIGFAILVIVNVVIMVVSIQLLYVSMDIRELTGKVAKSLEVDTVPKRW